MEKNPLLEYFAYSHLPEHLQAASKPFHDLAVSLVETHKPNVQLDIALQKLIETKDAAVRSALYTSRNS